MNNYSPPVAAVDAPQSHLQENPFELARAQLQRVADSFGIDGSLVDVLGQCKKAVEVSVPVAMDDGSTHVFTGYRVTHNIARGPSKGGIRYHPTVTLDEIKALAMSYGFSRRCDSDAAVAIAGESYSSLNLTCARTGFASSGSVGQAASRSS